MLKDFTSPDQTAGYREIDLIRRDSLDFIVVMEDETFLDEGDKSLAHVLGREITALDQVGKRCFAYGAQSREDVRRLSPKKFVDEDRS